MGLNYNWSAMTTLVNNMSPNGNTNQGVGLAWGWMSLVGGGPFTVPPAKDPNYQYTVRSSFCSPTASIRRTAGTPTRPRSTSARR